jgi:hypothetical protein
MKSRFMWRITNVHGDVIITSNKNHSWTKRPNSECERVLVLKDSK